MSRRAVAMALLLAAVAVAQEAAARDSAVQARGVAFVVTVHGGDAALAQRALTVVEPVWAHVASMFGVAVTPPSQLLPVHLYRTPGLYEAADQRLTGGRFLPNQAMSHWQSRSAHVAVQPASSDAQLAASGLPLQTEMMLLWEATHVVRFHLCADFEHHPGWFVDGIAAATAQRVFRELHPELQAQPFFTQRWLRAKTLLASGTLPSLDMLLRDDTAGLDMRDRYAARVAWFEFVCDGDSREQLAKLSQRLRGPGVDAAALHAAALQAFADREAAFRAQVAAADPMWDEVARSLWLHGEVWRQQAFADGNAVAFCRQPVAGGAFLARGAVWVQPGDVQQLNFLFARDPAGFYSLTMVCGVGCTLFEYRSEGNQWLRLESASMPDFAAGVATDLVVQGHGSKLDVQLGSATHRFVLPRPLPEHMVWGIGAQAGGRRAELGTVGEWRGLTVTAATR